MGAEQSNHKATSFSEIMKSLQQKLQQYHTTALNKFEQQAVIDSFFKNQQYKQPKNDRMLGCVFGSATGDALGAYCEFKTTPLLDSFLEKTMNMPGGGTFPVSPGQFTDDTELTFHLAKGLCSLDITKSFSEQRDSIITLIAKQYVRWYDSEPFDIGITTKNALGIIKQSKDSIKSILQKIYKINKQSQSNGSLMRITPMAIFIAEMGTTAQEQSQFIKNQIGLIHANNTLKNAGLIWVQVLSELILRNNDLPETFYLIFERAEQSDFNKDGIEEWFAQAKEKSSMLAVKQMGWAKIGWSYGMNLLYRLGTKQIKYQQLNFRNEIQDVIRRAGDTDTNAAIVGGLLGSIIGFSKIPTDYLEKMLSLRFDKAKNNKAKRPSEYEPLNLLLVVMNMIKKCRDYRQNHKDSKGEIQIKKQQVIWVDKSRL